MNASAALTLAAILPLSARAATTANNTFVINTAIPDNSAIGLSDTRNITSTITFITDVNVQILLNGGWSGDLYAYLTHGSGFSVLLNRPGRSLAQPAGSGATDLSVNFADNALTDLHDSIPNFGIVSGIYQPDARNVDPDASLDTSSRTAFLSTFTGLDANGEWTLFIADVSTGDTMTLESWSLTLTGVPEPSTAILVLLGSCCLLFRHRRGVGVLSK